jgi:hypothetical protein
MYKNIALFDTKVMKDRNFISIDFMCPSCMDYIRGWFRKGITIGYQEDKNRDLICISCYYRKELK